MIFKWPAVKKIERRVASVYEKCWGPIKKKLVYLEQINQTVLNSIVERTTTEARLWKCLDIRSGRRQTIIIPKQAQDHKTQGAITGDA